MPGLIENKLQSGNTVYGTQGTGYNPTLRTVDAGTETVSAQLNKILASGSPYITAARTGAVQTAAQRGLINSSIAAGAGEEAAIKAALPIAAQDASTYTNAAAANQGYRNTASQFGAQATNTANLATQAAANTSQLASQQTKEQAGITIPAQTAAAKELAQQAANIQTKQIIPAQTQAQQQLIGTQTGAQKELASQQADFQKMLVQAQGAVQSGLSAQAAAQQIASQRVQAELQQGLIKTQEGASARLAELQGQISSGLLSQQAQAERQLTQLRGQIETGLQQLRGTQAQDLAGIEANYKTLIQANASASSLYNVTMATMAQILANTDTTQEQKQQGVGAMTQFLQSGLAIIGGVANIDLAGLLNFT